MVTGQQIVPPRSTVTLRGVPESVAVARHRAMELLGEGHPAFEDVVLLVSEVVTNSVVHSGSAGGGRVAMTLAVEAGTVTVEVRDAGSADSVPRVRIAPDEEGGRGCSWSTCSPPAGGQAGRLARTADGLVPDRLLRGTAPRPG
nr:hypothetical protein GCM10020093_037700 [Planobispora longispora]